MLSSSTNNFANAQTLSRMSSLSGRMNIAWINIGFFTGFKKIKQRHCIYQYMVFTAIFTSKYILLFFSRHYKTYHRIRKMSSIFDKEMLSIKCLGERNRIMFLFILYRFNFTGDALSICILITLYYTFRLFFGSKSNF